MNRKCFVPKCNSNDACSFHEFPSDESRKMQWLKNIILLDPDARKRLVEKSVICSSHFEDSCFLPVPSGKKLFLKKDAIPTIFTDISLGIDKLQTSLDQQSPNPNEFISDFNDQPSSPDVEIIDSDPLALLPKKSYFYNSNKCFVPKCSSNNSNGKYTLHEFPSNESIRIQWLNNVMPLYEGKSMKICDRSRVCGKHFEESCYCPTNSGRKYLRKDAVPTIFTTPSDQGLPNTNILLNKAVELLNCGSRSILPKPHNLTVPNTNSEKKNFSPGILINNRKRKFKKCFVPKCNSYESDIYIFHEFPANQSTRLKWINNIMRYEDNIPDTLCDKSLVCSKHFDDSCYSTSTTGKKYLRRDAVPTIFTTSMDQNLPNLSLSTSDPLAIVPKKEIEILKNDPEDISPNQNIEIELSKNKKFKKCFVPTCSANSNDTSCAFFEFPTNEKTRIKWTNNIMPLYAGTSKYQTICDDSRVCSSHFEDSCYFKTPGGKKFLRKDAVPTIFNTPSDPLAVSPDIVICNPDFVILPDPFSFITPLISNKQKSNENSKLLPNKPEVSSTATQVQTVQIVPDEDIANHRKLIKHLKQKVNRLDTRIQVKRKKIEKLEEKVDTYEHQSLNKIRHDANENNPRAVFLLDQILNYKKERPRWSELTIGLCDMWRKCSPTGYEYPRFDFLPLPSRQTIERTHQMDKNEIRTETETLGIVEIVCEPAYVTKESKIEKSDLKCQLAPPSPSESTENYT